MAKQKLKPEETLMEVLNFSEADLEVNQSGRITECQLAHLAILRQQGIKQALFLMGIGFLAALYFIVPAKSLAAPRLIVAVIVGVLAALYPIYILLKLKATVDLDMREKQATSTEGFVQFKIIDEEEEKYQIKMQEQVWRVGYLVYDTLRSNVVYRVYYTPHSKTILSAEWLSEA